MSRRGRKARTAEGRLRACIYCRVSTSAQEREGTSLATQEERCRAYVAAKGYTLDEAHVIIEQHSGGDLYHREGINRVLMACQRGEVDVVVAWDLDRVTRDSHHWGFIASSISYAGARIELVNVALDDTPIGRMVQGIQAGAAELERAKIAKRTQDGRQAALREGRLMPGAKTLYGYNTVPREQVFGTKARVVKVREINDETAAVVRRIFAEYAAGLSVRKIAQRLGRDRIRTPGGRNDGRAWHATTINDILRNPAYGGRPVANMPKGGAYRDYYSDKVVPLPSDTTPAIVSWEVFTACQKLLSTGKSRSPGRLHRPDLAVAREHVRCGYCGRKMAARTRKRGVNSCGSYYFCPQGKINPDDCPMRKIGVVKVDQAARAFVLKHLGDPLLLEEEFARTRADRLAEGHLDNLDRRLAEIERERANNADLYARLGSAVEDLVLPRLAALDAEKQSLLIDRAALAERHAEAEAEREALRRFEVWRQVVAQNLETLEPHELQMALRAMRVRIDVFRPDETEHSQIVVKGGVPAEPSSEESLSGIS